MHSFLSVSSHDRRGRQPGVQALDWLGQHPQSAQLLQAVRRLQAVQAALGAVLPPALARRVQVGRIDGPQITLMVPGPAHAARLRQLADTAARHLSAAGWPTERIIVRIDAGLGRSATEKPRREAQPLGAGALQAFAELQGQVAPGPLADAIARLLRHHGRP